MTKNNPVKARFVRTGVDGILHLFYEDRAHEIYTIEKQQVQTVLQQCLELAKLNNRCITIELCGDYFSVSWFFNPNKAVLTFGDTHVCLQLPDSVQDTFRYDDVARIDA